MPDLTDYYVWICMDCHLMHGRFKTTDPVEKCGGCGGKDLVGPLS